MMVEHSEPLITQLLGREQDGVRVRSTATLVRLQRESQIVHFLVDCGSQQDAPELRYALQSQRVAELDALIITHSHFDHCGGLTFLTPKPKRIFNYASMGGAAWKELAKGVFVAKTPGHSMHDISVIVAIRQGFFAVIAGDCFEDEEDEQGGWKANSANPSVQIVSRKFIQRIAKIIFPGHGLYFGNSAVAHDKDDHKLPSLTQTCQMERLTDANGLPINAVVLRNVGGKTVLVVDGAFQGEIANLRRFVDSTSTTTKIAVVVVGTSPMSFVLPFEAAEIYCEDDRFCKEVNGYDVYDSLRANDCWPITNAISLLRVPSVAGMTWPVVLCRIDSGLKLLTGSHADVAPADLPSLKSVLFGKLPVEIVF